MTFLADLVMAEESWDPPRREALRVLVCEDEGLTALRLQRSLAALGYEVVGEARDGDEAVRLAERLRPDLILMDVRMPRQDGIAATQAIMERSPTTILMLTAYSEPDLVRRALAAGASGYVVKPVMEAQLEPAISVARDRFAQLRGYEQATAELRTSFFSTIPALPGYHVATRYEPAAEISRIGGDFVDLFHLGEQRVGLVIGDVCGSGTLSARYTALARHTVRAYALEDPSPGRVLTRLNRALYSQMTEEYPFLTLFYGVLDLPTGALVYSNGGHPEPLLCVPGRLGSQELRPTGGLIGAISDWEFGEASTTIPPGATLALFTDGVLEARRSSGMLGHEGAAATVEQAAGGSAESVATALLEAAREAAGGYLKDDVAILVVRNG